MGRAETFNDTVKPPAPSGGLQRLRRLHGAVRFEPCFDFATGDADFSFKCWLVAHTNPKQSGVVQLGELVDRRSLILSGAALLASTTRLSAQMPMRLKVAHPQLVQQQCPQWCWAASASMMFASLGHPIDQMKIVEATYHGQVCGSAQTGIITGALNAAWIDEEGRQFTPRIEALYDQANGVTAIDNAFIVNELLQDRPLLYANAHHCMVLVEAYYFPAMTGPNVVNAGVLDPLTGSFHLLTQAALIPALKGGEMMYLAAVRV